MVLMLSLPAHLCARITKVSVNPWLCRHKCPLSRSLLTLFRGLKFISHHLAFLKPLGACWWAPDARARESSTLSSEHWHVKVEREQRCIRYQIYIQNFLASTGRSQMLRIILHLQMNKGKKKEPKWTRTARGVGTIVPYLKNLQLEDSRYHEYSELGSVSSSYTHIRINICHFKFATSCARRP